MYWKRGTRGEGIETYAQPDIQHSSEPGGGGLIGIWTPRIDLTGGRIGILSVGEGGGSLISIAIGCGIGIIGTIGVGIGSGGVRVEVEVEGVGGSREVVGIIVVVVFISSVFIGILKFDLWDNFGIDFIHCPDLFKTSLLILSVKIEKE